MSNLFSQPKTMARPRLKVLFICRGSARDGIGHVIRTRTVARALGEVASVKVVVLGDDYVANLMMDSGLDYLLVQQENEVGRIFGEYRPDVSVFDLMNFDEGDFRMIGQASTTVSLSPIFNCLSGVELLFHRTSIPGEDWPTHGRSPRISSGLEYTVVGEHCRRISEVAYRRNLEHETLSVAISMGGTDAANKTLKVVQRIKELPEKLLLWVLLGEGYAHSYQTLVDSMHGSPHEMILAKTNDSMWHILETCSLAILAGGTTTYEAAFAGLPSVITLETKQHFFLVQELVERGVCLCTGYTFSQSLCALNDLVGALNRNRHELLEMHLRSKDLIDGLGVRRIIDEIQGYCWERQ